LTSHFSRVLFQENDVSVVEYSLPASELADGTLEDTVADDSHLATFRKLIFSTSPTVTQSLVRIENEKVSLNHLLLVIHRFMASASLAIISQRRCRTTNILVLGAGGCVVPSHILATNLVLRLKNENTQFSVKIDAVEPSSAVLRVAQEYFGAKFVPSDDVHGLTLHNVDGGTFLSSAVTESKYDVVIVDAAEDEIVRNTNSVLISTKVPPQSIISAFPVLLRSISKDNGILVINVFGEENRARDILTQMKEEVNAALGDRHYDEPVLIRVGVEGNFALLIRRRGAIQNSESLGSFVKRVSEVSEYE